MTDEEFQIDNFMLYCSSKNLAKKKSTILITVPIIRNPFLQPQSLTMFAI
ncbi:hypothetical protein J31TS6_30610 [Brevibacillus reuszeri]|nr:hypothetical protein J31TS6_30610 [Brevibacillus reuszeri]